MVQNAKNSPLINKVFDLYNYSQSRREFPILSLLQHYGAPTPLMDWTYNKYVALHFAVKNVHKNDLATSSILSSCISGQSKIF